VQWEYQKKKKKKEKEKKKKVQTKGMKNHDWWVGLLFLQELVKISMCSYTVDCNRKLKFNCELKLLFKEFCLNFKFHFSSLKSLLLFSKPKREFQSIQTRGKENGKTLHALSSPISPMIQDGTERTVAFKLIKYEDLAKCAFQG
jgi:hypothetical protein